MDQTANQNFTMDEAATTPESSIDLRRVSLGSETFSNPFFWIMVGIIGTVTVQYLCRPKKTT